jgi:glycosyltransferase involved in cell wall biosynthesis
MNSENHPLISCVCVTRNRPSLLRRSISFFTNQTYPNLELIVACDIDDLASQQVIHNINDPRIRMLLGPPPESMSLGRKRNHAIASASGLYVAVWDDDDWHGPDRIFKQYKTLCLYRRDACVISPVILCNMMDGKSYLGQGNLWECTLIAKKDTMPSYHDLPRGEDTPVVHDLFKRGSLAILNDPNQYIYAFHGHNTWGKDHWDRRLLPLSLPIGDRESVEILNRIKNGVS